MRIQQPRHPDLPLSDQPNCLDSCPFRKPIHHARAAARLLKKVVKRLRIQSHPGSEGMAVVRGWGWGWGGEGWVPHGMGSRKMVNPGSLLAETRLTPGAAIARLAGQGAGGWREWDGLTDCTQPR
jgi:hypothetical protein